MKNGMRKFMVAVGALALALIMAPGAVAQCGLPGKMVKPAAWHPMSQRARLVMTSFDEDGEGPTSIVGFWHVIFTAQTSNGQAIPDTMIDNALSVWHSDKTEIMNSIRPPQDGNFCLGVWERTGRMKYVLNHYAWFSNQFPNDPPVPIGPPSGPTHFVERVTLSPDGNQFTGTFTLDAFDATGKTIVQSFTGAITGTRITVNTAPSDLF